MESQDNILEHLVGFIRFYEESNPEIIDGWKKEIDKSGIGTVLNFALRKDHEERAMYYYVTKSFWIILRYCKVENYKGLRQWLSYNIDNENTPEQLKLNSAKSIDYLLRTKLTNEELQNIEFENIIFGNGKSKELITTIINGIKPFVNNVPTKETITGFSCSLHPDTVKEIYIFMAGENHLSGKLTDFQAIFSKVSIPVENPVKWQILNNRGTKSGRGNQTALFEFLKLMLGTVSNSDLKKCKSLFIDEKGYFIENELLRPDRDKVKTFGFETNLNDILKKADQPKNQ